MITLVYLVIQDDEEVGGEGSWGDLVQRRYRRMMVLAVSLPLLQQASGINSITFYSSSVSPLCSTASVSESF